MSRDEFMYYKCKVSLKSVEGAYKDRRRTDGQKDRAIPKTLFAGISNYRTRQTSEDNKNCKYYHPRYYMIELNIAINKKALGYWKQVQSEIPDYETSSLSTRDVIKHSMSDDSILCCQ